MSAYTEQAKEQVTRDKQIIEIATNLFSIFVRGVATREILEGNKTQEEALAWEKRTIQIYKDGLVDSVGKL